VPASQLDAPATVTVPAPASVPLLCVNDAMLDTPFSVSVPPERLVAAPAPNELATVRLPPVTASMSSPMIARLLIVFVPERKVTVCAPATLITTSSSAPGNSGFEPQFVAMSQKLVPPTQFTVAASAGAGAGGDDGDPDDARCEPGPLERCAHGVVLPLDASEARSRWRAR
jgi:hypothetical protein